ncbi:hypothetical protein [Kordiimonas gwangyangensis]|uniref:hypothetical protein n=1 Tax=Kordiimonas gwangyangensis TaxID=288022 RepID=UPI00038226A8|nr:hypothetical protein [Kordiimonas gwangyangensis]
MKVPGWRLAAALLIVVLAAWFTFRLPEVPTRVVTAEVVSLEDLEGGWRAITVKFKDGRLERIETLTPFFFKPGYPVHVGVYERLLFADHYDIVAESKYSANP